MLRSIDYHTVPGDVPQNQIQINAIDERGVGGANHLYEIRGFNTASNPSDPFVERYGSPSDHTTIIFQNGPIKEKGTNGITQESMIAIVIDRIEGFQSGQFACDDNAQAIAHLKIALACLKRRTEARIARGVEGTLQK